MKIVVGSQSAIKLDAVKSALRAYGIDAEVVGVKADSCAPEQPVDAETEIGARNRAAHAQTLDPTGDIYVAVENGIFKQPDGRYIDKAVVLTVTKDGHEDIAYSEGVEFPLASVEEARRLGFDKITVGKVMAEGGIVAKHDDPHITLSGKPRAQFLTETISTAFAKLLKKTEEEHTGVRPGF